MELEELYLGVPDESVNLTFKDLAQVRRQKQESSIKLISVVDDLLNSDSKSKVDIEASPTLAKLPSLDFNRALGATTHHSYNNNPSPPLPTKNHLDEHPMLLPKSSTHNHYYVNYTMSHTSGTTSSVASMSPYEQGRRRAGIPHSNICTLCTTYIYIFRHRCLVCGRVYCRQCVRIGMGDMSEGRKCVECLGRKFSQRYIQRAGQIGCCMGYSSTVKQQELKWAEKGPRRSGENRAGRSPSPRTPNRAHSPRPTPFVMDSPYSPYTPTRHHRLPL